MSAHAYMYAPKNDDFEGTADTLPPVLLKVHGGPTGATSPGLSLDIQYWTSRGFVVLDLNYRGSTGYGTEYRNLLKDNWGVYDVEDCAAAVEYTVKEGLVDVNKTCIEGGSSGGYTTLAVITFTDAVKAGCARYGISDCIVLAEETHKFESRYTDSLIGLYPQMKEKYQKLSPINYIDKITAPCIFFHGGKDKVVPPNQSEMMYNALKDRGITTAYVFYPEEGHGFRDSKNKQNTLDGTLYFFSKVFGFEAADKPEKEIPIVNARA